MNVLVLGSGGREHSLCYNLIKSKKISNLWCMPGNAGINRIAKFSNLNTDDNHSILDFCIKKKINLVIPGSEEFLAKGVGDYLRLNGIKVFGPSKKSALLESSKIFTKQICKLGNINTAKWEVFDNSKIALKKIRNLKFPIVIKLDKLAAGKGVLVAKDLEDAKRFLKKVEKGKIGDSNSKIIVEKKLTGKEASFFYVVDGNSSKFIGSAQDYKRVGENNTGLNTGGMGCISPSPYENEKNIKLINKKFIEPTIKALMAPMLLLTPVLWKPAMLGDYQNLIYLNPFTYFIGIVRNDLIGIEFDILIWIGVFVITVFQFCIFIIIYSVKKNRIVFWV